MLSNARVLYWIGLLCLVVFFFPFLDYKSETTGSEGKFTLGLPSSPWFVASWLDKEERIENGTVSSYSSSHSHSTTAELISWSALFGIAGMALMAVSRRLKAKEAPKA